GDDLSGADVVEAVVARMTNGPKPLQIALARAHAGLDAGPLAAAFQAARQALPPTEVYDLFAGYLAPKEGAKKGQGEAKKQALIAALGGKHVYWHLRPGDDAPTLDPRWLDLAVRINHLGLVHAVGWHGNPVAEAFVQGQFDAAFAKAKNPDQVREAV